MGDRDDVDLVVDHDEPGRARARRRPRRGPPRSAVRRGATPGGTGSRCRTARPRPARRAAARRARSRTWRSGVPSSNSPTPARSVRPLTVHTIVPGDSSVPTARNHVRPLARRCAGTLASVSTLLTRVGGASVAPSGSARSVPARAVVSSPTASCPARYGGATRGNGGRPSDDLEQGGLLAERGSGPSRRTHRARSPGPSRRPASAAIGCLDAALARRWTRTSGRRRCPVRADGVRGDQRAFEHAVRVAPQEGAVLERARLALGAVDHDGGRLVPPSPATVRHLVPVGKPAPPRPRSPDASTVSMTASGSTCRAASRPRPPPAAT